MDQHTATGPVPGHPYHVEAWYVLTVAGHAVLTPAGDAPPPFVAELTVPPGAGGVR